MQLLNLKNVIGNLELGTGTTMNIENMEGNQIRKLQRNDDVKVNFGGTVSKRQEKKMLRKMVVSNNLQINKDRMDVARGQM